MDVFDEVGYGSSEEGAFVCGQGEFVGLREVCYFGGSFRLFSFAV